MAGALHDDTRMTDVEALMWRLEQFDARFRSVITVVVALDRSPGLAALLRRVDVLSRVLPRFRSRVEPPATGRAVPRWIADHEFDLERHVRLVPAPGEGTLDDVLGVAATLAADGLDPHRPLWQIALVEGMGGGRAAVVVRLHHTFTDGLGALKLAMVLFDLDPDAPEPDLPGLEGERPPGTAGRMVADVSREVARAAGVARWALPAAGGLVRDALADPQRRAASVVGMARSLGRAVAPSHRPRSPVMTGRSTASVFGALALDLADARAVAASAGCTVNDVFLSAVLDGLRRYHARHASRPPSLRLGMPVSLRGAGDDRLRNLFFPARLDVPLQELDPLGRLRAVHDLVAAVRAEPALGAYEPLAAVANRAPGAEAALGRVLASIDVMASNVTGSADPLYLAGARVLRLVPFGPRSGSGLNVTTVSYDGTLHVGVNLDPSATPDTGVVLECLADAFAATVIYA